MADRSISGERGGKQQYWQKQIALWRRSGSSKAAFCREHKLCRWTFHYWKKKLQRDSENTVSLVKLPAITIGSAETAAISVKLGEHYSVEVRAGFEAATLSRVLDVLESRSC